MDTRGVLKERFFKKLIRFLNEESIDTFDRFSIFHRIQRNYGLDADGDTFVLCNRMFFLRTWNGYECRTNDKPYIFKNRFREITVTFREIKDLNHKIDAVRKENGLDPDLLDLEK